MAQPTNRSEARDLLRRKLADCDLSDIPEDLEDAIADMLLEQISAAKSAGAYEVERTTLDPVFKLIGSAKIRLGSIQAFHHLQRFSPEMLVGNNHAPRLDKLVIDAIEDLAQAEAKDDRIPF